MSLQKPSCFNNWFWIVTRHSFHTFFNTNKFGINAQVKDEMRCDMKNYHINVYMYLYSKFSSSYSQTNKPIILNNAMNKRRNGKFTKERWKRRFQSRFVLKPYLSYYCFCSFPFYPLCLLPLFKRLFYICHELFLSLFRMCMNIYTDFMSRLTWFVLCYARTIKWIFFLFRDCQ